MVLTIVGEIETNSEEGGKSYSDMEWSMGHWLLLGAVPKLTFQSAHTHIWSLILSSNHSPWPIFLSLSPLPSFPSSSILLSQALCLFLAFRSPVCHLHSV